MTAPFRPRGPRKHFVQPGDQFTWLTVLRETWVSRQDGQRHRAVVCLCTCGNEVTVEVAHLFRATPTRSCGCLRREMFAERSRSPEGVAQRAELHKRNAIHGLCACPLYGTWNAMLRRCEDPRHPAYHRYGGRGIKVCDRWHDPATFIADIERLLGPRPDAMTLDRIDNDGNYEPGNVRWATASQQQQNRSSCPQVADDYDRVAREIGAEVTP